MNESALVVASVLVLLGVLVSTISHRFSIPVLLLFLLLVLADDRLLADVQAKKNPVAGVQQHNA